MILLNHRIIRIFNPLLFLFSLLITIHSFGQKTEKVYYGLGALYNFQTNGVAVDLRARLPLYKNLFISPRLSYFPKFNNINEYYLGADLDYQFMKKHRLRPYIYAAGYYDNWINSYEFKHNPKAQKNNIVAEGGAGLIFCYKCLHPYIEYRYDTKWKEGSLGAGILFNWGCCFKSKKASEKTCPKFQKKKFILF